MKKVWQVINHNTNKFLERFFADVERGNRVWWQVIHHIIAHPLIGFSGGWVWAWKFHDWTLPKAWPDQEHEIAQRWAGLE